MARSAGQYREAIVILTRSTAAADGTGEEVESWPEPAAGTPVSWAAIEGVGGSETSDPTRHAAGSITLRFRDGATIAAVDRFRVKATSETYRVTGVWKQRDETSFRLETWVTGVLIQ